MSSQEDTASVPQERSTSYRLRRVRYAGRDTYMVCHGHGDHIPPIIPLLNFCLLNLSWSRNFTLDLRSLGGDLARNKSRPLSRPGVTSLMERYIRFKLEVAFRDQMDKFEDNILAAGMLTENTDFNPILTKGTQDFAGLDLPYTFGQFMTIQVHHGYLIDPKDAITYNAVGDKPFNELKLIEPSTSPVIGKFLDSTKEKITTYGMTCFNEAIHNEELALLYKKDHLCLVCKKFGSLFVLETDDNNWANLANFMWKTLEVDIPEILLTEDFIPLPLDKQPNKMAPQVAHWIERWEKTMNEEKEEAEKSWEVEIDKSREVKKMYSRTVSSSKKKIKKKNANRLNHKSKSYKKQNEEEKSDAELTNESGSAMDETIEASIDKSTVAETTGSGSAMDETTEVTPINESSVAETTKAPHIEPTDEICKWVADNFTDFLENFREEDAQESPESFFVREAENLKFAPRAHRRYCMHISFQDIEKYNKGLADAISSDYNRYKSVLTNTLADFWIEHKCGSREVAAQKTRLVIYGVPRADSTTQSFLDFVVGKKMVEPYTLYDGRRVNSTSHIGRRVGRGYVNFILRKHKQHISWNGEFNKSDMVVKDGEFTITKPAVETASQSNMKQDLAKLFDLILEHYKSDDIEGYPAYFDQFHADILSNVPDPRFSPGKLRIFQKYLAHHPVFKSPLARSSLFHLLYRVCNAQRREFEKGYPVLNCHVGGLWQTIVNDIFPLSEVYKKKGEQDQEQSTGQEIKEQNADEGKKGQNADFFKKSLNYRCDRSLYWQGRYWDLLKYIRHFNEQMTDHTKIDGVQQVQDVVISDLTIGHYIEHATGVLIFQMMCVLTDDKFSNTWRFYETSENSDEPESTSAWRS